MASRGDVLQRAAYRWHRSPLVRHGELDLRLATGRVHAVSRNQVRGEWFLAVDVAAGFGSRLDHLHPVGQPSWSNADDVELFVGQHPTEIGVAVLGSQFTRLLLSGLAVRVGHSHEFCAGDLAEG